MQDVANLIQNFGLAVAILIVLGVFLWRLLVWVKPWIEKLINTHIAFVNSTSATVAKISDTVDELKSLHVSTSSRLDDIASNSKRASDLLQKMANHQNVPGVKKQQPEGESHSG